MAFDLKKYRDENVHWYGDAPLEDVAKDIYERGGEEYHGGRPFEDWSKETGIADQLAKDAEERQRAEIQRQKQESIANREIIGGLASDVAGGLVDYGELGMRAVRAVSPEGSWLERKATEGIEGIKKVKEESPFLASPEESPDTGFFSRAIHGGVRSAAQSIAAGLPSALAGAAMGSAAGPLGTAIGAVAGYALGGATQFGLAQYDDVMERGLKAGKTREEVEPHAIREGLYEGGFEFASDLLEGMTMGAGKLLTAPGKQAAKATIKDMMKTSFKDLAKRTGKTAAIETGSEMLTSGAEAEEEHALGIGNERFWSAATDAFGPSMVASLIFAGLGHANVKYAQSKIRKTLENPEYTAEADKKYLELSDQLAKTRDPKKAEQLKGELQGLYPRTRAAAIDEVYATLQEYNPTVADVWGQTAYQALREGKAISTQENVMEMQEQKKPSPKGYKLLPPPEAAYPAQPYSREFDRQAAELQETPALPAPERQAWTGADEQFVLGGEYSPYSPEFAGGIQRNKALPPAQGFELRGAPEDVYSPYSPEFAGEINRRSLPAPESRWTGPTGTEFTMGGDFSRYSPELAQRVQTRALPAGQEFELRGAPEDVASPYYPEVAQANLGPWKTKGRQTKLPPAPTGFQMEQESVRQKYEQASTRVKNLSTQMDQYRRQLDKIDPEKSPERRDKILGRIRALQDQIDANRETQKKYEAMLGQDIAPTAAEAPKKSARESAEAFEREAGRVQSPVGKEGLRRKLGQEEKQSWEIERARATQMETEETANEIPAGEFPRKAEIDRAAHAAATSPNNTIPQPTEAQKEAGNYQKGHIQLHGLDISIENPKGSERSGTDKEGKRWSTTMQHHYGYIKGTKGKDKDHLDVFVGPKPENGKVYVVDQVDPGTGKFDEHKVLMGFRSEEEARKGYLSNYEKNWKGLGNITEMDVDTFKQWTKEGDQKKPIAGGSGYAPQVIKTEEGPKLQKSKDKSQVEVMREEMEARRQQAQASKFTAPTRVLNEHEKIDHEPGYREYHVRRGKDPHAKTQSARATVRVEKVSGRPVTIPGFEGREFFTYKTTVPSGFKTEENHLIADVATGAYIAGHSDLDTAIERAQAILKSGTDKYLEGIETIRQPTRAREEEPAQEAPKKRDAESIIEEIGDELSKGGGSYAPTITRLYQELGQAAVPGVRLQDAEETGRLYRMHKDGMVTDAEWEKHVNSLNKEGRVTQELAKATQEVTKTTSEGAELAQALDEAAKDIASIQKETSSGPNKLTAKEVAREKANVKEVLLRGIKKGEIALGSAVRATELNELRHIIQKRKLLEGKSFEGTPGISATQITDRNNPAIPMYGSYDRIPVAIIAPKEMIIGKGQSANEVLLDPKADVTKLRFSLDTQDGIYAFAEIPEVLDRMEAEMKGETTHDREGEGRMAGEERGREKEPRGTIQGEVAGGGQTEAGGVLQTREGEEVALSDDEIASTVRPERFTEDPDVVGLANKWNIQAKRQYLKAIDEKDVETARAMDGFGDDPFDEGQRGDLANIIGQQLEHLEDVRSKPKESELAHPQKEEPRYREAKKVLPKEEAKEEAAPPLIEEGLPYKEGNKVVFKWGRSEHFGTIENELPDGRFVIKPDIAANIGLPSITLSDKSLSPYIPPKFQVGDQVMWMDNKGEVHKGKILSYWSGQKYKIEEKIPGGKSFTYKQESDLRFDREEEPTKRGESAWAANQNLSQDQGEEKPTLPGMSDTAKEGFVQGVRNDKYYQDITTLDWKKLTTRQRLETLRDMGATVDAEGFIHHPGYILYGREDSRSGLEDHSGIPTSGEGPGELGVQDSGAAGGSQAQASWRT